MWEAYDWKREDLLWPGTAFRGGIAGQQEGPCGAVSGMAMVTGLRHRCPSVDIVKAEQECKAANDETGMLVKSFKEKFGAITCLGLMGVDFNDEKAVAKAKEAGTLGQNCLKQVQYAIEKLYELESQRP
jgi:hypothetical protein